MFDDPGGSLRKTASMSGWFRTTSILMPPRCLVWVATASRGADLVFLGSAESRFSAPA